MRQDFERIRRSAERALVVGVLLAFAVTLHGAKAAAQGDPDMREIIPYLMLVIDTSGSMERLPACACTTPSCEECLPDCSLANDADGTPPKDAQGHERKKNRWAVALEALTGTFQDFQCEPIARTTDNGMDYDVGYYLPYHQPWDCTSQLAGTPCAYGSSHSTALQNGNGIIDTYKGRVRFGLMTFDGFDTFVGAPPLVSVSQFETNEDLSNGVQGLWSYGGGHSFHYPRCTENYMIDTGVRSPTADQGTLISLNSCLGPGAPGTANCPSWCGSCPADNDNISSAIETALLKVRPYGGTPIAASLDDLYYHIKVDLNRDDQFGSCRRRFALLMTDGYPDDDYRQFGCNCKYDDLPGPMQCKGEDPEAMHCPYPTSEEAADYLIHGRPDTTDKPMLEELFVVGLAIDDNNVLTELNKIARAGCSKDDGCEKDADHNVALFASDLPSLVQSLGAVIDNVIEPISRSVPSYAMGTTTATNRTQYQLSAGFELPVGGKDPVTGEEEPWTGLLERRLFTCKADGTVNDDNTIDKDPSARFHDLLNSRTTSRVLYSTAPPSPLRADQYLYSGQTSDPCGAGCSLFPIEDVADVAHLGAADETERSNILRWVRGTGGVRQHKRLGDIYHSSPVIVGAPQFDTSDEAFNLFRQRPVVAQRPLTMFVGSNDGILHAFSVEESAAVSALNFPHYDAGEEMWGFIPPLLLDNLKDNLTRHQFMMDGTPLVKNVYFHRALGDDATGQEYHTVLITGMREGGASYIALDVTDVTHPQFLWQFNDVVGTESVMGKTFAQVGVGQATFKDQDGNLKNGAVAIIPGGVGELGPSGVGGECSNGVTNQAARNGTGSGAQVFKSLAPQSDGSSQDILHRGDVRCWKDVGRALYFVDIETGKLIKKIHRDSSGKLVFPSPLVSTPAVFSGDIGARASRAFVVDADGVIWRIDLTSDDQDNTIVYSSDKSGDPDNGWVAKPFHDIFWDMSPYDGELTYEAPILSVDADGNVIVIVGTGDNNNFVKPTIKNRVVSLTEKPTQPVVNGPIVYRASVNWEKRVKPEHGFVDSELVTGTMSLFEGQLFFGTFIAVTGADACDLGKGRIHAVDYLLPDQTDTNGSNPETYGPKVIPADELAYTTEGEQVINIEAEDAVSNFMLMGLSLTERPTCSVIDEASFDVYGGKLPGVTSLAQPALYLVAQASGSTGANSLIQKQVGSKLGSVQLQLNKTAGTSKVTSWATSLD
jgi:type IV pilus assembly protein PilY1